MAQHGGKRVGAGRKPSSASKKTRETVNKAVREGRKLPLEFLLAVMADEKQPMQMRFEAAQSCLPYCHPRLTRPVVVDDMGEMRDAPKQTVINIVGIPHGQFVERDDDGFPTLELISEAEVIVEPEPAVEGLTADEAEHIDLFS